MEDILLNLNSFSVTGQPNSVHAEHPRFSQFKTKHSKSSQQERRRAVLAARKEARYDLLSHVRRVEQGASDDAQLPEDAGDVQDAMEGVVECYQKPKRYQDFLMLSEWLVDVPEDFATTHLAVPCPVGKRCLVVAGNGKTTMYGRNGKFIERFHSVLPGGSPLTSHKGYAMFDCVVCYDDNIFYILDMIAWMNQSMMQCETPFRFEWTKSRLEENEYDTTVVSDSNDYKFIAVKYHDCDKASLQRMLELPLSFGAKLDGILFYHKNSHYTHGPTPLVGWLKAYMMEEILGMEVPEQYKNDKPEKYTNLQQHIEYGRQSREDRLARNAQVKEQKKDERQKDHAARQAAMRANKKNSMDTTSPTSEDSENSRSPLPPVRYSPSTEGQSSDSSPPAAAGAAVVATELPAELTEESKSATMETTAMPCDT